MFMKKQPGPRVVILPDGSTFSRADLPDPNTRRWVASRKAAIVKGVSSGVISAAEVFQIYGLSKEELNEWQSAMHVFGEKALRATAIQKYRQ